jgi:hypothetical protein
MNMCPIHQGRRLPMKVGCCRIILFAPWNIPFEAEAEETVDIEIAGDVEGVVFKGQGCMDERRTV